MENKEQVVIKECGMRFVLESNSYVGNGEGKCEDCIAKHLCINSDGSKRKNLIALCWNNVTLQNFKCTSATKIEDEAKVYHAWNAHKAQHLIGCDVECHSGSMSGDWEINTLKKIGKDYPFYVGDGDRAFFSIREIKPETITLTEARERFNIPANVLIDGE